MSILTNILLPPTPSVPRSGTIARIGRYGERSIMFELDEHPGETYIAYLLDGSRAYMTQRGDQVEFKVRKNSTTADDFRNLSISPTKQAIGADQQNGSEATTEPQQGSQA